MSEGLDPDRSAEEEAGEAERRGSDSQPSEAITIDLTQLGLDTRPELVFALLRTLGSDTQTVLNELEEALSASDYHLELVKLSNSLKLSPPALHEAERYERQMDMGDELRRLQQRGDAILLLGIKQIEQLRAEAQGSGPVAYVIDSLMHPDEVKTLRAVYGRRCFVIACDAPLPERRSKLAQKFRRRSGMSEIEADTAALHSISRDAGASESSRPEAVVPKKYRLAVGKTYQMADLFVQVSDAKQTRRHVRRLVESIMSYPYHTPTLDERGMATAYTMSMTTATLSRRVGAAVMRDGQIIAVGANEVPAAGGGMYHDESDPDGREWVEGVDPSDAIRAQILADLIRRMIDKDWLTPEYQERPISEVLEVGINQGPFAGSELLDIIEYGRTVHAEMIAITGAARLGISVLGATLYTTTLPCHECTRNIIASGIGRLVYLEPYAKSKGAELQWDAVTVVAQSGEQPGKLSFQPFAGFSSNRFMDLFSWVDRKVDDVLREDGLPIKLDGKAIPWKSKDSRVRPSIFDPVYGMDDLVLQLLREKILNQVTLPKPTQGAPDAGKS